MKKKSSYRWLIWIILAVILIGVALMHILPPYIDRDGNPPEIGDKLAEAYVNIESEPDDGKQKKKDWWATDVKVEFDKLKAENPDVIGWIRFDNQDELGINYPTPVFRRQSEISENRPAWQQPIAGYFGKVLTNLIFDY